MIPPGWNRGCPICGRRFPGEFDYGPMGWGHPPEEKEKPAEPVKEEPAEPVKEEPKK